MSSFLNMLNPFNARLLETIVNQVLTLDPQKDALLKKLHSQTLTIKITDWNLSLTITPSETHLNFSNEIPEDESDCLIEGNLTGFIKMALASEPQAIIQTGEINQQGNIHVLQNYQALYQALDIDWEYHLAEIIGTTPAHLFLKPFKSIKDWTVDSHQKFKHETDEYLHEEARCFPPAEEINDFYDDIQTLRNDVDRMEAKIALLLKDIGN